MRKYWFAYLAKALVVFPGGFGTIDEMFELLTLAQTEKLAKKITIVCMDPYWKQVLNLDVLVDKGAISPKDRDLFHMVDTPEEAFEALKHGLTQNHLEPEARRAQEQAATDDETSWVLRSRALENNSALYASGLTPKWHKAAHLWAMQAHLPVDQSDSLKI